MNIQELEPRAVWQYFHQITQVPRPSAQEEKIQQYILDEAASSVVGPPVGDVMVSLPSTPLRRSTRPAKPCPLAVEAPPMPLSLILTSRAPSATRASTPAAVAPECLLRLARASLTTK